MPSNICSFHFSRLNISGINGKIYHKTKHNNYDRLSQLFSNNSTHFNPSNLSTTQGKMLPGDISIQTFYFPHKTWNIELVPQSGYSSFITSTHLLNITLNYSQFPQILFKHLKINFYECAKLSLPLHVNVSSTPSSRKYCHKFFPELCLGWIFVTSYQLRHKLN